MMGERGKVSFSSRRTIRVEIENEAVANFIRIAVGAPENATVELGEFSDTIVTWTETEEPSK